MADDSGQADTIEITPAMIEEGVDLLSSYLGDQNLSWMLWSEVLTKLYMLGISQQHHKTQRSKRAQPQRAA